MSVRTDSPTAAFEPQRLGLTLPNLALLQQRQGVLSTDADKRSIAESVASEAASSAAAAEDDDASVDPKKQRLGKFGGAPEPVPWMDLYADKDAPLEEPTPETSWGIDPKLYCGKGSIEGLVSACVAQMRKVNEKRADVRARLSDTATAVALKPAVVSAAEQGLDVTPEEATFVRLQYVLDVWDGGFEKLGAAGDRSPSEVRAFLQEVKAKMQAPLFPTSNKTKKPKSADKAWQGIYRALAALDALEEELGPLLECKGALKSQLGKNLYEAAEEGILDSHTMSSERVEEFQALLRDAEPVFDADSWLLQWAQESFALIDDAGRKRAAAKAKLVEVLTKVDEKAPFSADDPEFTTVSKAEFARFNSETIDYSGLTTYLDLAGGFRALDGEPKAASGLAHLIGVHADEYLKVQYDRIVRLNRETGELEPNVLTLTYPQLERFAEDCHQAGLEAWVTNEDRRWERFVRRRKVIYDTEEAERDVRERMAELPVDGTQLMVAYRRAVGLGVERTLDWMLAAERIGALAIAQADELNALTELENRLRQTRIKAETLFDSLQQAREAQRKRVEARAPAPSEERAAILESAETKMTNLADKRLDDVVGDTTKTRIRRDVLKKFQEWGVSTEAMERALEKNRADDTQTTAATAGQRYFWSGRQITADLPAVAVFAKAFAELQKRDPMMLGASPEFPAYKDWRDRFASAPVGDVAPPRAGDASPPAASDPPTFSSVPGWFFTHIELYNAQREVEVVATWAGENAVLKRSVTDNVEVKEDLPSLDLHIKNACERYEIHLANTVSIQVAMDEYRATSGFDLDGGLAWDFSDDDPSTQSMLISARIRVLKRQKKAIQDYISTVTKERAERLQKPGPPSPSLEEYVREQRMAAREGQLAKIKKLLQDMQSILSKIQVPPPDPDSDQKQAALQAQIDDLTRRLDALRNGGDGGDGGDDAGAQAAELKRALNALQKEKNLQAEQLRIARLQAQQEKNADSISKAVAELKTKLEGTTIRLGLAFKRYDERRAAGEARLAASEAGADADMPPTVADDDDASLCNSTFTGAQLEALFDETPEVPGEDRRTRQELWASFWKRGGATAAVPSDLEAVVPAVFRKANAKALLREHLLGLFALDNEIREPHLQLATCIENFGPGVPGPRRKPDESKLEEAIEQLLPFFESMVRYRNTMVAAKLLLLSDEKKKGAARNLLEDTEAAELSAARNRARRTLEQHAKHIPASFCADARRMIALANGRLPDPMTASQPLFLPLRISAPPRVGKSATTLMTITLARRLGMLTLYSLAPNKKIPIDEMMTKLGKLGWVGTSRTLQDERRMRFHVTRMIGDRARQERGLHENDGPPTLESIQKHDLILYSSEQDTDVEKAAAVLGAAKLTSTIVFHARDEAQFLVKEDIDESTKGYKTDFDAPPPKILSLSRHFYGNLYNLNCLVSATLIPTLDEEGLWGYYGSATQNLRIGLSPTASEKAMGDRFGAELLPSLVPALQPTVPTTYMGSSNIATYSTDEEPQVPVHLKASTTNYTATNRDGSLKRLARFAGSQPSASNLELVDLDHICGHFEQWLDSKNTPIGTRRTDDRLLVPTYIGALSHNIVGGGLCSWVRMFGRLAHMRWMGSKEREEREGMAGADADVVAKFGCVFILFTSTMSVNSPVIATVRNSVGGEGLIQLVDDPEEEVHVGRTDRQIATEDQALCFFYSPENNTSLTGAGGDVSFLLYRASSVQDAIYFADARRFGVVRFAILGHDKLAAGLTVQTTIKATARQPERFFCPSHMALSTSTSTTLDSILQMVGRTFVDLRTVEALSRDQWAIHILGSEATAKNLTLYESLEKTMADAGGVTPEDRMFQVLRKTMKGVPQTLQVNFDDLGTVGTRRARLSALFGSKRDAALDADDASSPSSDEESDGDGDEDDDEGDEGEGEGEGDVVITPVEDAGSSGLRRSGRRRADVMYDDAAVDALALRKLFVSRR